MQQSVLSIFAHDALFTYVVFSGLSLQYLNLPIGIINMLSREGIPLDTYGI